MAARKQLKKDFSKEAMYRKIMPSISAPIEIGEPPEDSFREEDAIYIPEYEAYNVMELVVRQKLIQIMDRLGACDCERCKSDSAAIALNSLDHYYMTADAERIREKAKQLRARNELKITAAVIRAVQTVMESPRHDAE